MEMALVERLESLLVSKFKNTKMYITEVIIDGFKSYSSRTVVSGFDPHFNAITGLNGSGKSNILDAICFVLGITNLSQVKSSVIQYMRKFIN